MAFKNGDSWVPRNGVPKVGPYFTHLGIRLSNYVRRTGRPALVEKFCEADRTTYSHRATMRGGGAKAYNSGQYTCGLQ